MGWIPFRRHRGVPIGDISGDTFVSRHPRQKSLFYRHPAMDEIAKNRLFVETAYQIQLAEIRMKPIFFYAAAGVFFKVWAWVR